MEPKLCNKAAHLSSISQTPLHSKLISPRNRTGFPVEVSAAVIGEEKDGEEDHNSNTSDEDYDDQSQQLFPKSYRPQPYCRKACQHCRRVHLSCDFSRPCKRCKKAGIVCLDDVDQSKVGRNAADGLKKYLMIVNQQKKSPGRKRKHPFDHHQTSLPGSTSIEGTSNKDTLLRTNEKNISDKKRKINDGEQFKDDLNGSSVVCQPKGLSPKLLETAGANLTLRKKPAASVDGDLPLRTTATTTLSNLNDYSFPPGSLSCAQLFSDGSAGDEVFMSIVDSSIAAPCNQIYTSDSLKVSNTGGMMNDVAVDSNNGGDVRAAYFEDEDLDSLLSKRKGSEELFWLIRETLDDVLQQQFIDVNSGNVDIFNNFQNHSHGCIPNSDV